MNFKTIRNKLTVSGNIINSILNYKVMGWSAFYGYLKNRKKSKDSLIKKIEREKCRSHWKKNFHVKSFLLSINFLTAMGFFYLTN